MPHRTLFAALALMPLPALAETSLSAVVTEGNARTAAPSEWLGEAPHLVMLGTVNGTRFDVQVTDPAAVAALAAKREYLDRDGGHLYLDFEVALEAEIGGIERQVELEFENADFAAHSLPATFAFRDEEFPAGLFSNMEVQFEWEAGGTSVNEEVAGWTGSLTMQRDTGTPDDKGLLPDGTVAGFVTATRGADSLVISFTVPVAEYEIED